MRLFEFSQLDQHGQTLVEAAKGLVDRVYPEARKVLERLLQFPVAKLDQSCIREPWDGLSERVDLVLDRRVQRYAVSRRLMQAHGLRMANLPKLCAKAHDQQQQPSDRDPDKGNMFADGECDDPDHGRGQPH